jgi:hypothetical protein
MAETRELVWRCSCNEELEGTPANYMNLIKSKAHKGHKVVLVDKQTGEIVATSLRTAQVQGILPTKGDYPPAGKATLTEEGLIIYTLIVPVEAFAYFNMAKQFGLIKDGDMSFDEWVFECIDRRFATDYGIEIVLQPIASKKVTMEEMINEAVKKAMAEALGKGSEKTQEG